MNPTDPVKDDLLSQIWSISTTLTDEAMNLAASKAEELKFDPNRGLVPLAESFINLSSARTVLEDAIEKQKLIQLPITVQKEILSYLEGISKSLRGLTDGSDEIANLTAAIEGLNTAIWKYGLHNLSDQVLGYQKKLNQLKNQEVLIAKIAQQLESARQQAQAIPPMVEEAGQKQSLVSESLESSKQAAGAAAALVEQLKDSVTQSGALLATVQQNERQSSELTATVRTAASELSALDASIRKFYGEIDEYRRKITQTNEDASRLISESGPAIQKLIEGASAQLDSVTKQLREGANEIQVALTSSAGELTQKTAASINALKSELEERVGTMKAALEAEVGKAVGDLATTTSHSEVRSREFLEGQAAELQKRSDETIGANDRRIQSMIEELGILREQIRQQIQQATGFTLFGAFQARQNQIVKSKNFWVWAIGILVAISASVTIWIAHEAQSYNTHSFAFWVKLSLTLPLGYALTFCTVQYSRERRLEEEYAFKSSISVSLNPYRDLVHSILEKEVEANRGKYTDFVIDSVTRVFTSPTEKVFDAEDHTELTKKTLKDAAEVIGTAVKAVK